jgi:hypothetical protein
VQEFQDVGQLTHFMSDHVTDGPEKPEVRQVRDRVRPRIFGDLRWLVSSSAPDKLYRLRVAGSAGDLRGIRVASDIAWVRPEPSPSLRTNSALVDRVWPTLDGVISIGLKAVELAPSGRTEPTLCALANRSETVSCKVRGWHFRQGSSGLARRSTLSCRMSRL